MQFTLNIVEEFLRIIRMRVLQMLSHFSFTRYTNFLSELILRLVSQKFVYLDEQWWID